MDPRRHPARGSALSPPAGFARTWASWRDRAYRFTSGGLDLAGYDLGDPDGRPLTFLHGYPSASHDIEGVVDRLGTGWRVLALDFPGFGASSKPADHRYAISGCADAVEDLWRQHEIDVTALVAHDYGASVCQELLARREEATLSASVDAVVWMNGGIYPDLHRPTAGQQLLLDPDGGPELAAAVTREMFADGLAVTWGQRMPIDGFDDEIWASMDDGGGVARMHDLLHYVADRRANVDRWQHALEQNGLPQVFVWGDLDPVSGAHMIERVEARVAGAEVRRLADVGHWPPLEAPDEVAAAIAALD